MNTPETLTTRRYSKTRNKNKNKYKKNKNWVMG
jgi:hypothetical protein